MFALQLSARENTSAACSRTTGSRQSNQSVIQLPGAHDRAHRHAGPGARPSRPAGDRPRPARRVLAGRLPASTRSRRLASTPIHYIDVAIACDDHPAAAALYERLVPYAGQVPTNGGVPYASRRPLPRQARHAAPPLRAGRRTTSPAPPTSPTLPAPPTSPPRRPRLGHDVPPAQQTRRRRTGPKPPRLGTIGRRRPTATPTSNDAPPSAATATRSHRSQLRH